MCRRDKVPVWKDMSDRHDQVNVSIFLVIVSDLDSTNISAYLFI